MPGMRREKMAQRWRVPQGVAIGATARIAGVLWRQPAISRVHGPDGKIARAVLQLGDEDITIVARGKVAEKLAALRSGTFLTVAGELVLRSWKTANAVCHRTVQLEAKLLEPGPLSTAYEK